MHSRDTKMSTLASYWWTLHCSCHCQFPVSFDHSQATRCSVTVSCWAALAFCHAAGGRRHCQDSDRLSDSSSCHLQEAGRASLHCQVTPLCAASKDTCLQCQHQLFETFPVSSSKSQRYCFCQLLTFFQSLFSRSASLLGTTALSGTPSPFPSATLSRGVSQPPALWWCWWRWWCFP